MSDLPRMITEKKENARKSFTDIFKILKKFEAKDPRKEALGLINMACVFGLIVGIVPFVGFLFFARSLSGSWEKIPYEFFLERYIVSQFLIFVGLALWLYLKKSVLPAAIMFFLVVFSIIKNMAVTRDIGDGITNSVFFILIFGGGLLGAIRLKKINETSDVNAQGA